MTQNLSLADCGITVKDGENIFTEFRDFCVERTSYKYGAGIPFYDLLMERMAYECAIEAIRCFLVTRCAGNTSDAHGNAFCFAHNHQKTDKKESEK